MSLAAVLVTSHEAVVSEDKSEESGDKILDSGERHRRSGDIVGYIGSKLGSKISAIASASAGLSSLSSAPKPEYGPPVSYKLIIKVRELATKYQTILICFFCHLFVQ